MVKKGRLVMLIKVPQMTVVCQSGCLPGLEASVQIYISFTKGEIYTLFLGSWERVVKGFFCWFSVVFSSK